MTDYTEHLSELNAVFTKAIEVAQAQVTPDLADELYIVGLDVDGQFHTVTVGVSNVNDVILEIDASRAGLPAKVIRG